MNKKEIFEQIQIKKSFLCIGLDPDLSLVPAAYRTVAKLYDFLKAIIDSTAEYCVAYKPNLAFYECLGVKGQELYEQILGYIPDNQFIIADAKRGDIGNTSEKYAESFYNENLPYRIDGVTLNPYMGKDAVLPFIKKEGKWAVILALTSNESAAEFQLKRLDDGLLLYEKVIEIAATWGTEEQIMFVVGATRPEMLQSIRKIIPKHFLLVPGIGAQGGSLEKVCKYGMTSSCGLLINAGRSILYASSGDDFAKAAGLGAKHLQQQMEHLLSAIV